MAKVAAAAPVSAPPPVSRVHLLALLFLALAYAVPVVSCWNMAAMDEHIDMDSPFCRSY